MHTGRFHNDLRIVASGPSWDGLPAPRMLQNHLTMAAITVRFFPVFDISFENHKNKRANSTMDIAKLDLSLPNELGTYAIRGPPSIIKRQAGAP